MQNDYRTLRTFADVCADQGKDQSNYAVPSVQTDANGKTTNSEELALAYLRRTMLIAKAVNGPDKLDVADTRQEKYGIWAHVNPTEKTEVNPAGFGLSFCGCDCGSSDANLGVRPQFSDYERGEFAFEQFKEEWEQLMKFVALWMLE
jgi:hypothetical protein